MCEQLLPVIPFHFTCRITGKILKEMEKLSKRFLRPSQFKIYINDLAVQMELIYISHTPLQTKEINFLLVLLLHTIAAP